jgi:hypothetical protein
MMYTKRHYRARTGDAGIFPLGGLVKHRAVMTAPTCEAMRPDLKWTLSADRRFGLLRRQALAAHAEYPGFLLA